MTQNIAALKPTTPQLTRGAMMLALILAWQYVTLPLNLTLVTGTVVNMLLVYCVISCGAPLGVAAAVLSPIGARLLGIGSVWALVPYIAVGNIALVLIWHFITRGKIAERKGLMRMTAATVSAAVAKFIILYCGVVLVAVPQFLRPDEATANALSATFSLPQLVTALIGGVLAAVLLHLTREHRENE